MSELHPIPGCRVEQIVSVSPACLEIAACGIPARVCCPSRGSAGTSPRGSYPRRPRDLPSAGREVRLILRVRRFLCGNPACRRQTLAEPSGGLLTSRARRTDRLAVARGRVALVAGGEAGARLLDHLGMPASPDILLRLVRRMPLPPAPAPGAVGVDDWALRRPDLRQHPRRSGASSASRPPARRDSCTPQHGEPIGSRAADCIGASGREGRISRPDT